MTASSRLHRVFGMDAAEHGRFESVVADESVNLQVINLGLSRTGTTSLNQALEMLGFGPGHQGVDLYRFPQQRTAFTKLFHDMNKGATLEDSLAARLRYWTRGYRSAGDGPINNLPELALMAYPRAKFVLTTREGGKHSWWKSFDDTVGLHFRKDFSRRLFRFLILPVGLTRTSDDFVQEYAQNMESKLGAPFGPEIYTLHNERVHRVIPKDRLLEYNVREGWEPLCKFLEVPVPDVPFPRLNEAESMKKIYFGMQAFGAFVWVVYLSVLTGILYFAFSPSFARQVVGKFWNAVSFIRTRS